MHFSSFPFSDGVPLIEKKFAEHADGAFSEVANIPFCFDSKQQKLWCNIQMNFFPQTATSEGSDSSEKAPTRVTVPNSPEPQRTAAQQYPSSEVLASLSLALLRDGVVILHDPAMGSRPLTEHSVSTGASSAPELDLAVCSHLAHPTLMALLDGVLGQQVLRRDTSCGRHPGCTACSCEDSGALEGVVVPAGLFTDDLPLRALPWELQEVLLQNRSVSDGSAWVRGCEMGKANFPLHTPLDEVVDAVWATPLPEDYAPTTAGEGIEDTTTDEQQPYMQFVAGSHRMAVHCQQSKTDVLHWRGRPGEVCVFLGSTLHRQLPAAAVSSCPLFPPPLLTASYHTAYLRQRADLYLQYPPSTAIDLPPYIQRLLGYGMHAPVLNKLYCGAGPFSILPAYEGYGSGSRPIDWAGAAVTLPGAAEYARFCGWMLQESKRSSGLPPPPPLHSSPVVSSGTPLSTTSLGLALDNIGSYMRQLPPQHHGIVTVDTSQHNSDQTYGLALAAMVRDGCVVLGKAVSKDICEDILRQVSTRQTEYFRFVLHPTHK